MKKFILIILEVLAVALFMIVVMSVFLLLTRPKVPDGYIVETKGNIKIITYIKENDMRDM